MSDGQGAGNNTFDPYSFKRCDIFPPFSNLNPVNDGPPPPPPLPPPPPPVAIFNHQMRPHHKFSTSSCLTKRSGAELRVFTQYSDFLFMQNRKFLAGFSNMTLSITFTNCTLSRLADYNGTGPIFVHRSFISIRSEIQFRNRTDVGIRRIMPVLAFHDAHFWQETNHDFAIFAFTVRTVDFLHCQRKSQRKRLQCYHTRREEASTGNFARQRAECPPFWNQDRSMLPVFPFANAFRPQGKCSKRFPPSDRHFRRSAAVHLSPR